MRWCALGFERMPICALSGAGRASRALLDGVNDLVGDNIQAAGALRAVLARAENEVRTEGESTGVVLSGKGVGRIVVVQAKGGQIETENRLKTPTDDLRQGLTRAK